MIQIVADSWFIRSFPILIIKGVGRGSFVTDLLVVTNAQPVIHADCGIFYGKSG